jgi:hypothetical protein
MSVCHAFNQYLIGIRSSHLEGNTLEDRVLRCERVGKFDALEVV